MRVYLDQYEGVRAPTLYVERFENAPLDVLDEQIGAGVITSYALPSDAVELIHPDDAVALVLERLADVPMARGLRAAIADRLDVDIEDVGCAPARKAARKRAAA